VTLFFVEIVNRQALSNNPMSDLAVEFVAYVLTRLPVDAPWLKVWDEAQAVARRRAFRGMGYFDLLRAGVPLSLDGAERLGQIVDQQKCRQPS